MPQEGAFVATLYAPIMFPPAPVLVFTQDKHTSTTWFTLTYRLYFALYVVTQEVRLVFDSNVFFTQSKTHRIRSLQSALVKPRSVR